MTQNNYTVQYIDGKWQLDVLGAPRVDTYSKKSEAVKAAKSRAKRFGNSLVEIYRKDGTLQDTVTYEESSKPSSSSGGVFSDFL